MTPYAVRYISEKERSLFMRIKDTVERMEDPELGLDENGDEILLSCHILARAVADFFPVRVKDGYFADCFRHSWVETEEGHLIDLYPVACLGGPIMLEGKTGCSPKRRIYVEKDLLEPDVLLESSFQRSVELTGEALLKAMTGGGS